MGLSKSEIERYSRQLAASGVGARGQARLASASALVVGAGGLGGVALAYLCAAGVGRLGFSDPGPLELSNLNRQILYKTRDIGRSKARLLASFLRELNPGVRLEPMRLKLNDENLGAVVKRYSIVLDCTDNYEIRFALNRACARLGRTLVHGAVYGFEGQLAVLEPRKGPCLECVFPAMPPAPDGILPVLGPTPGAVGSMQAMEAIKALCGLPKPLGRLLMFDFARGDLHRVELKRRRGCPVCGGERRARRGGGRCG